MTYRAADTEWTAAGGEGFPPLGGSAHGTDHVWLFTCRRCGRRFANPPASVSNCHCGCGDIAVHRFRRSAYLRIRWHGDPRRADQLEVSA